MYKVFVNERPLIFSNTKEALEVDVLHDTRAVDFKGIVAQLFDKQHDNLHFCHRDLPTLWTAFKASFKIEKAAGGLVYNDKEELLFIHRFGKWDLPKGHIEKGEDKRETAIREVEEECGITDLEILNTLPTTYHMFKRNGEVILKITYWYQMFSTDKGDLVPQQEEGIDAVCFKSKEAQEVALSNSYENIVLLVESCEELK
ncbi:MAG: NUDIX domain-containing protein [Flavobacteriaceae bacterium]|nr:NUDIX domain-containing protein [Flavobacteriaceae bacterium]